MTARQYDRRLGIRTEGMREWRGHSHYNPYEATPYEALEQLFREYSFRKGDRVVDFGCGRGRVIFAIHHRFRIPVVGIEANEKTFQEALANKNSYCAGVKHLAAPIELNCGLAEHYAVQPGDNRFYFFNPFSDRVFQTVVGNILKSAETRPRPVDTIMYYPLPEYEAVVETFGMERVGEIPVPELGDALDKFLIYRWEPAQMLT